MSLHSVITVANVRANTAPLLETMVQVVHAGYNGTVGLTRLSLGTCERFGLGQQGAQVNIKQPPGKSTAYRFLPNRYQPLNFLLTITKPQRGGKSIRKCLGFRCGLDEDHGEVTMRWGTTDVRLLSGPLRRMHGDELQDLLRGKYSPVTEYTERDLPRWGVKLSGMTQTQEPTKVQTVGTHGEEQTVFVKRAPRRFKL
jgi:hypothetical protein